MFFQRFDYGETSLCFAQTSLMNTKKTAVGVHILPKGASYEPKGDDAPLFYAEFSDGSSVPVKSLRQVQFLSGSLNSYLSDENNAEFIHKLVYDSETGVFSASVRYENKTKEERCLKSLTSFSFGFLFERGMQIVRMGSAFSYAYSIKKETLEELGLGFEKSPPFVFGRDMRFLPFVALQGNGSVLAIRLDAPEKFEIKLRRAQERIEILGSERFGSKILAPGGSFETCKVHFTLQPTLEKALHALNRRMAKKLPAEEGEGIVCSAENIALGNMKKFSALLRELKIPCAVMDEGKKPRTEEELQSALTKLSVEGIRAESSVPGIFSLPHLGNATAIAAANITRVLPARKIFSDFEVSASESDEETLFKFCAAAMVRIKLKGELLKLPEEKIAYLKTLFAFNEKVREIVLKGEIVRCEFAGTVSAEPQGTQIYIKEYHDQSLIFVHFFETEGVFKIPLEGYEIQDEVSSALFNVRSELFRISGKGGQAGAFLLKRREP